MTFDERAEKIARAVKSWLEENLVTGENCIEEENYLDALKEVIYEAL